MTLRGARAAFRALQGSLFLVWFSGKLRPLKPIDAFRTRLE
jgi:hypothetical protein